MLTEFVEQPRELDMVIRDDVARRIVAPASHGACVGLLVIKREFEFRAQAQQFAGERIEGVGLLKRLQGALGGIVVLSLDRRDSQPKSAAPGGFLLSEMPDLFPIDVESRFPIFGRLDQCLEHAEALEIFLAERDNSFECVTSLVRLL